MDQIFFVIQTIHMIVEWNAKKLHKVYKKLGEMTNVFQSFRNPDKGGQNLNADLILCPALVSIISNNCPLSCLVLSSHNLF